ncbi:sensor histidine kinase [Halalkalibacter okhensis]|uniref:histidine kinase n=1 Tax=Halalkalibacter okhensis TaxID=333138 RepID=A0A0B0IGZ7_9BACI|nr:sensor histidine kinase [Halalkalibacter okhensis]KHF40590.1 histidine kinase [Halalkalibacter okhensis]
MASFWIWLLLLGVSWFFALTHFTINFSEIPFRMVGCAGFFALFFLSPLFRTRQRLLTIVLCLASIITILSLWPEKESTPNIYILLVLLIIAGKAVYRLQPLQAGVVGVILFSGTLAPYFLHYPSVPPMFLCLYGLIITVGLTLYRRLFISHEETLARNEALLTEYRKMKRRVVSDEKLARQEERSQIAREIHDSVGHKLTALLMQLEVFRMQSSSDEENRKIVELKKIAKESLEETRSAVKTLKQDDVRGLSAIIGLIRKLEAESFIRVQFTVKHGALSAPLLNSQAIAVYRVVQEALTNVMRHSGTREVDILFEAPGGTLFRFEVSNQTIEEGIIREGFGLTAMRERMEHAGGKIEVKQYNGRFIVRGTLSLPNGGGMGQ